MKRKVYNQKRIKYINKSKNLLTFIFVNSFLISSIYVLEYHYDFSLFVKIAIFFYLINFSKKYIK